MKSKLLSFGALMLLACGTATAEDAEGSYKPGKGFTWATEDGDHAMNVGGRVQARYTFMDYDEDRDKDEVSDFEAKRVRVHIKGHVFRDVKYKFQADFGDGRSGDNLKDAVITYARVPEAQFSAGQFKTRFDHQEYVSSGKQQFVDRNEATRNFGIGRDIGIMLHGVLADEKFEYNVGVFNGEGEGGSNKNDGHLLVGRVSFQPLGAFGYSEGDLKRDDPRWILSLGGATNNDLIESNGDLTDVDTFVATVGFRARGIYLMGEYYWQDTDTTDGSGSKVADVDSDGFYFQIGYVFPSMWDIAARYAYVDPNDDVDDDEETELMIGFNKYFMGVGHSLKFTLDLSWLEEELGSGYGSYDDFRVRAQGQIVF